jgi:hypothetical protein
VLEAVRQIEAQVDRAFGAFSSGVHMIHAAQASSEQVGAATVVQYVCMSLGICLYVFGGFFLCRGTLHCVKSQVEDGTLEAVRQIESTSGSRFWGVQQRCAHD